jgi:hypothetical protein
MDRALDALTTEKCGCCREKHVRFEPERNNPLLNGYNPAIILAWCANIDVKPVMSTDAALKGVPLLLFKLTTYNTEATYPGTPAIPNSRLPRSQNCCRVSGVALRMLGQQKQHVRSCSIYSAQETAHLLLGIPLVRTSVSFQTLHPGAEGGVRQIKTLEEDDGTEDPARLQVIHGFSGSVHFPARRMGK